MKRRKPDKPGVKRSVPKAKARRPFGGDILDATKGSVGPTQDTVRRAADNEKVVGKTKTEEKAENDRIGKVLRIVGKVLIGFGIASGIAAIGALIAGTVKPGLISFITPKGTEGYAAIGLVCLGYAGAVIGLIFLKCGTPVEQEDGAKQ